MKEVILSVPSKSVTTNSVRDDKYYGVLVDDEKGFVTRHNCDYDYFFIAAKSKITNGGCWHSFTHTTLQGLIEFILNPMRLCNYQIFVYEFATSSELFTWLAE